MVSFGMVSELYGVPVLFDLVLGLQGHSPVVFGLEMAVFARAAAFRQFLAMSRLDPTEG